MMLTFFFPHLVLCCICLIFCTRTSFLTDSFLHFSSFFLRAALPPFLPFAYTDFGRSPSTTNCIRCLFFLPYLFFSCSGLIDFRPFNLSLSLVSPLHDAAGCIVKNKIERHPLFLHLHLHVCVLEIRIRNTHILFDRLHGRFVGHKRLRETRSRTEDDR